MLLLTIAALSTPAAAQQHAAAAFMVRPQVNPLKNYQVASATESHPFFVDIDGDGDLDCFAGEYARAGQFASIYFYRNEGTRKNPLFKPVSGAANPLDKVQTNALSIPYLVDIDGDGDQDCFIGEGSTGALVYYRNAGTATHPRFEKQSAAFNPLSMVKLSTSAVASPAFADVDGDGDPDCVVVDEAGLLHYYRNVGNATHPRFEHVTTDSDNPFAALARSGSIYNLSFEDWNKDGLVDLFVNTTYYKNTGTSQRPQFTAPAAAASSNSSEQQQEQLPSIQNTLAAARYSYTPIRWVDLDGDGTPELMQGTAKGGFIYQTLSANKAAVEANTIAVSLSPNPSKSAFTIHFPAAAAALSSTIRILDVQGKVLSTLTTTGSSTLKVGAALQPGIYLLQIRQNNTVVYQQKIIKE